jgi:hypothetical protein
MKTTKAKKQQQQLHRKKSTMHVTPQNCHPIGRNRTTKKDGGIIPTTVRRNRRGLHQRVRPVEVLIVINKKI